MNWDQFRARLKTLSRDQLKAELASYEGVINWFGRGERAYFTDDLELQCRHNATRAVALIEEQLAKLY